MDRRTRYPQEVRERAVRMVFEHSPSYDSQWAAVKSISSKFGVSTEDAAAVGQAGRDRRRAAARPERRANPHEGARAQEPRVASRQRDLKECRGFLRGGARPPTEEVVALMSVSDIAFTWLDWTGRYFSGHVIDFGWMTSLLLIAIAASLAADAADTQKERLGG